ncbi:MAG: hypothetical protein EB117_15355, partial [Betaproteobacteria bacterium]|nr:hypothetical protein [Betaproteobacteria bacterium]
MASSNKPNLYPGVDVWASLGSLAAPDKAFDVSLFADSKAQSRLPKLPSDWANYSAKDKINWFVQNGFTSGDLQKAGVKPDEMSGMFGNGFYNSALIKSLREANKDPLSNNPGVKLLDNPKN